VVKKRPLREGKFDRMDEKKDREKEKKKKNLEARIAEGK